MEQGVNIVKDPAGRFLSILGCLDTQVTVVLPRGLSPQECKAAGGTSIHSLQHGIEIFSHRNNITQSGCFAFFPFYHSVTPCFNITGFKCICLDLTVQEIELTVIRRYNNMR